MRADAGTLGFYDLNAADYADFAARESVGPTLDRFAAGLAPGGRVLDLGCGSGWAAAALRDRGFDVQATDASVALAVEGRRRYGLDIRVARFDELDAVAAFDGVWASFSLLHDTRDAMPANLARIACALRPGGLLYLGLKEGEGSARDRLGRFYTYFGTEEVRGLLAAAGFGAIAIGTVGGRGYDGAQEPLMHVFARLGADG